MGMKLSESIESCLNQGISNYGVPGASVAIMKNGRIVCRSAAGIINSNTKVSCTIDTAFQIGSITKVFTATLIMQLKEEGLLELDDVITKHIPDFRVANPFVTSSVTVRHLLNHSSGIDGDLFPNTSRGDDSVRQYVDMCAMLPSLFDPGTQFSYCNSGFVILSRIVEILTGQTFDDALKTRIFQPLQMDHSFSIPDDSIKYSCAIGHFKKIKKRNSHVEPVAETHLCHGMKGAGSMATMSASDLLKFTFAHINKGASKNGYRLLKASSINAMQKRQIEIKGSQMLNGVGLGWMLGDWSDNRVVFHNGGTLGQSSMLVALPDKKSAMVLLINGGDINPLFRDLMSAAFSRAPIKCSLPDIPKPNEKLKIVPSYIVGNYENINGTSKITYSNKTFYYHWKSKDNKTFDDCGPISFIGKETAVVKSEKLTFQFVGFENDKFQFLRILFRLAKRT